MAKSKLKITYKNLHRAPDGQYFVGYLNGKRQKYTEQEERYDTPEEAMTALGINPQQAALSSKR